MGKNGKSKKAQPAAEAVPETKQVDKKAQEAEAKANREAFRGQVEQFLGQATELIKSEATRKELVDSASARPNIQLIEIQKRVWKDIGVDPSEGYTAVDQLGHLFPELLPKRQELGKAIHQAFMTAAEDRRPQEKQKDGKMSREAVLEFFDAKDVYFDNPAVRERMKKQVETDGKIPSGIVEEVHAEIAENLGFDWQFLQTQLKMFGDTHEFADDAEVTNRFRDVHEKTFNICMMQLHEYRQNGGKVDVDDTIMDKLLEIKAREELRSASGEMCNKILEKNCPKLKVLSEMPIDGRVHYLKKLDEEQRLELAKAELILHSAQQQRMHAMRQAELAEQTNHQYEKPVEHAD